MSLFLHKRSLNPTQPALTWEQVNENWRLIEEAVNTINLNTDVYKHVSRWANALNGRIDFIEHGINDPLVQAFDDDGYKVELAVRIVGGNVLWSAVRPFSGKIILI